MLQASEELPKNNQLSQISIPISSLPVEVSLALPLMQSFLMLLHMVVSLAPVHMVVVFLALLSLELLPSLSHNSLHFLQTERPPIKISSNW
jgi:hypothetical protein